LSNTIKAFCLIAIMFFSMCAAAADLKVGYVQVDKLLKKAPQTAETGKKLEQEFSPRSLELERMKKKISALEAALEKDRLSLTEADKRKQYRELSNLKIEFGRKQRELREDINVRKNEELAVLQDRINGAVKTVSEQGNYDLVMYGGVAYANKKIDITDQVLKLLNTK